MSDLRCQGSALAGEGQRMSSWPMAVATLQGSAASQGHGRCHRALGLVPCSRCCPWRRSSSSFWLYSSSCCSTAAT